MPPSNTMREAGSKVVTLTGNARSESFVWIVIFSPSPIRPSMRTVFGSQSGHAAPSTSTLHTASGGASMWVFAENDFMTDLL